MEHAHSVLHLFPSCVAFKNKLKTVNKTRNREQWRHAFYDNIHPCFPITASNDVLVSAVVALDIPLINMHDCYSP